MSRLSSYLKTWISALDRIAELHPGTFAVSDWSAAALQRDRKYIVKAEQPQSKPQPTPSSPVTFNNSPAHNGFRPEPETG